MNAKRACLAICALLGLAFVAPVARGASYSDLSQSCVSQKAVQTMEACPGGPQKFAIHKKRGATFATAPTPGKFKTNKDLLKPHNPSEEMAAGYRDTRKARLKARSRALLITEISGLENLYSDTPRNSPDRPQIIRRLAEDYVELESAALRDQTWYGIQAQNLQRRRQAAQAQRYSRASLQAERIVNAARRKAIAYYTLMANQYPHYSKIDEVLYYLAYEYEQARDLKMARKVYYQLIQQAPQSPYIPNAYLAFGELFFQEAQGDPSKWALAAAAYEKVIGYPPPKNKVFGYAHYKLGYVYWNQGDYAHAINEFKKVIEYGMHYSSLPNAPSLAKAARHDMIPVYAASGRPEAAYNFFHPLSGDAGADNSKTLEMENELGQAYLDTGHFGDGITLYKDLMNRDHGDKYCFYQSQITQATEAMKSSDKDAIRHELDRQMQVRKDFDKSHHSSDAIFKCDNRTADLFAETAMSWHLEAVGSGGVRGTGDQKTMDLAAYLYKEITQNFSKDEFAKFKFPRIVRADWPTLYKIKYDMADLLYFQKRWKDCGPAFDAVVAENPRGEDAAEAAYASVLCYQKMYDQLYKGDSARKGKGLGPKGMSKKDREAKKSDWDKLKPKPIDPLKQGMITAFNRYICYIKPSQGDKKAREQYVEVLYARARTYFDAQHWEEAALGFRDVALNYSDMDAGIYAAQLYLESVNVLGAHANPPRPSCFDDMARDVPTFLKLYCSGSKLKDNEDQCEILTRIQFDIQRLKAQKTVELADSMSAKGDYKDALDKYKEGGDAYLKLWRTYCEQPLSSGEHPKQCAKADEIVYDMAKAYQAGRLLAKSIQARLILLDPKYGLNKSPLAMKAIYEIGGNYQAIAAYDRAADFYERYAKATKYRGEDADKALSDATVLRLGLGDDDDAIHDANDFNRYYGGRKPKQAAQIAFAVAAHYGQKQDWDSVRKHLAGSMHLIDRKASLDIRLEAHALLGRAYTQMKSGRNAEEQYREVVKLWADPAKATNEITSDTEAGDPQRRLGRALESVGEGLFYFAEQKRALVEKVKFPVYKGPGTKEAVLKHINTKVKAWIKKKRPLILAATAAYKKVVDLQPVPPPRWVIAAGARVGQMWGDFVTEFRAAPIPDSIKKDYQLRTAYYGALDDASEPQKLEAKSAFQVCLNYSVKYQYFDEFSRSCEKWLAKNYKAQYHLIDEFRDSPNRANSALREHAYPLRIGGAPLPIVTEAPQPPQKAASDEGEKGKAEKSKKRRRR
jgi:tetratricopeptide (TPR) repeat protein